MTHTEMYTFLCGLSSRATELDCSYHAAFYLLSSDRELFEKARHYVDKHGVDFAKLKQSCSTMHKTQQQLVDIAHNLFSWTSSCSVAPFDISMLGYPLLDFVCNAFYISSGVFSLYVERNEGGVSEFALDRTKYERAREFHAFISNEAAKAFDILCHSITDGKEQAT